MAVQQLQQRHQSNVMALLDDSEMSLSLTNSSTGVGSCKVIEIEDSSMSDALTMQPTSNALTTTSAAARPMRRGGPAIKTARTTTEQSSLSEVPGLDKAMGKCKDPVVAACAARKVTLRMFGDVQTKLEKAKAVCQNALNYIQDDFTDEDILPWSFMCDDSCEQCMVYSCCITV